MKKLFKFTFLSLMILFISGKTSLWAITPEQELDLIKERYIADLLTSTKDEKVIAEYLKSLDLETGAWSDIDYNDQNGSGWETNHHSARIAEMAKFYCKYQDDNRSFSRNQLSEAIHATWRYWFVNEPYCETNWHPNVIGSPRPLCYSFIMMQDEMTPWEVEKVKEVVFPKTTMKRTATNLAWEADVIMMHSFFLKDCDLARKAIAAITSTICVAKDSGEEGIQPDNCYTQHGPQQNFGNYGLGILSTGYVSSATLLTGTSFALSDETMDIITNLLYDGYKWVMWRGALDVNATGRFFGENVQRDKGTEIINQAKKFITACNPEQKAKIQKFIDDNTTQGDIKGVGFKSFYTSDGMYIHTPKWAASLKMSSAYSEDEKSEEEVLQMYYPGAKQVASWTKHMVVDLARVIGTEQGNDNKKGYYMADGAFYTYVDGYEYENSAAVWDWRRVPGITCYESDEPIKNIRDIQNDPSNVVITPPNKSNFVGTCTDSNSGITTMILNRDGLKAHKSWIVTDEFALCLGSGIGDATGEATLTTSIDQRPAKSDLLYLENKDWSKIDDIKLLNSKDSRFYHDQTGYIILDGAETEGKIENRKGNWNEISASYASKVVTDELFSLFIRHNQQGDSYRYLILPARTKEEVAEFDLNSINIIQNDTDAVIVKYDDTYYITAFETGVYKAKGVKFKVSTPGLFMISRTSSDNNWRITAHDPTRIVADEEFTKELSLL